MSDARNVSFVVFLRRKFDPSTCLFGLFKNYYKFIIFYRKLIDQSQMKEIMASGLLSLFKAHLNLYRLNVCLFLQT